MLSILQYCIIIINKCSYINLTYIRAFVYNRIMKKDIINQVTTTYICYYIAFCPRYKRKIFVIPGMTERVKELSFEYCKQKRLTLLDIYFSEDTLFLEILSLPSFSPNTIIHSWKKYLSSFLLNEFKEIQNMPNLWTKAYYVSTKGFDSELLEQFINSQRKK